MAKPTRVVHVYVHVYCNTCTIPVLQYGHTRVYVYAVLKYLLWYRYACTYTCTLCTYTCIQYNIAYLGNMLPLFLKLLVLVILQYRVCHKLLLNNGIPRYCTCTKYLGRLSTIVPGRSHAINSEHGPGLSF